RRPAPLRGHRPEGPTVQPGLPERQGGHPGRDPEPGGRAGPEGDPGQLHQPRPHPQGHGRPRLRGARRRRERPRHQGGPRGPDGRRGAPGVRRRPVHHRSRPGRRCRMVHLVTGDPDPSIERKAPMRIAALGISHESNTYAPVPASLERWLEARPLIGDEIVGEFATAEATLSGYLELGEADPDVEIVPLVFYRLTPMGTITAEAFEHMTAHLLGELASRGPFDGVLLALHGAAVSEEYRDADGEIIRRVREAVGPDVPIGVSLDMHANVSGKMVEHATVLNTYMTNPHLDPRPRARQVADLIAATIRGEVSPVMHIEMVPAA